MATILQTLLILAVFLPLASFAFLAFFGARLPRALTRPQPHDEIGRPGRGHGAPPSDAHAGHGAHAAAPGAGEPLAGWIATGAIAASFVLVLVATVLWGGLSADERSAAAREALAAAPLWTVIGTFPVHFGVNLDSLTIIMLLMVTLCATCIHVFSIGYMTSDRRFSRFFAYLSLFCFSMLGLVISTSLVFLFVFWELVGICSYLLIGFWFEKKSASDAAIKAFVVNRIGDFGFLVGLGLCATYLGTFSLHEAPAVFEAGAQHAHVAHGPVADAAAKVAPERAARAAALFTPGFLGVSLATWLGIGLFCGAIGKSAQFPLQVWLPDAMEGPTPVSALIHAATMVAAGVYLVARVFTLLTAEAQLVIAVIGCITLTMAALIAIVQTDIKRVSAYSTLSQLGYMIFALGVGAWIAALFHLLTHAFFKALLFLGAGQVIAGCHHEQDMRKMGGLWGRMPRTAIAFLIAVLAISGAGIPWTVLGIGGFYSKDEILLGAWMRAMPADAHGDAAGHALPHLPWLLAILPLLVAYLTPFYMGRCFTLTFLGRPRDAEVHAHAHESPLMYLPLLALAGMTFVSGWFFRVFVENAQPASTALGTLVNGHHAPHGVHNVVNLCVGFAFAVGLGLAYWLYRDGLARAEALRRIPLAAALHRILWNKFYFDHVYGFVFVGGARAFSWVCRLFDNGIIDGIVNQLAYVCERLSRFAGVVIDNLGVDGVANAIGRTTWGVGGMLRGVQTGLLRSYVLMSAAAIASLALALLIDPGTALIFFLAVASVVVWPRMAARRPGAAEGVR